jgi:hypothetical protein
MLHTPTAKELTNRVQSSLGQYERQKTGHSDLDDRAKE